MATGNVEPAAQCVRRITGGEGSHSPTNEYYCRLSAGLRDEETPYDAALPLAKELAEALGVR